jgi:nicotinamide phosphoribosyltransferase
MYPEGTETVHSYYEARKGSLFPKTTFFGLQYKLKKDFTQPITKQDIKEGEELAYGHFGNRTSFNSAGWNYILNKYGGYLPLVIKALPEGINVPINNVLFTVENVGGPNTAFLTSYVESTLSHLYYPITVATLSQSIYEVTKPFIDKTSDNGGILDFMLHDFGYRSYTGDDAAEIGSLANLIKYKGTDTILALKCAHDYYGASYGEIGYSVPASEHSVMSALGRDGERDIIENLLNKYPKGILSVVGDTYDIYNFVTEFVCNVFKDRILNRDGVFVIRPDSTTPFHTTKALITLWIVEEVYKKIGGYVNSKGYKVINDKVRVLYGDGLNKVEMVQIFETLARFGYSASNIATFGCGSGLIQKGIDRDVCRFAFKSSAQKRNGKWYDVYKEPLDKSKASKRGRFKVVFDENIKELTTVDINDPREDRLVEVFNCGQIKKEYTLADVRANANK